MAFQLHRFGLYVLCYALTCHAVPAAPACLQEELAAELCLLAPARLEHLIPPMPRMMHAVLRALRGSDQSVSVALKVGGRRG